MRATILAALLAAPLLAAPLAAQGQTSEDPCATVPADSKQRIDGKKSGSSHVSAFPTSFAGDGCDMLVVDVTIPAGNHVTMEGGVERGSIPTSSCEEWSQATRWYRKSGGKHQLIGEKRSAGTAGSDACSMEQHVHEADATAQTTFRIAVSSLWSGGPLRVRTGAAVRPLSAASH